MSNRVEVHLGDVLNFSPASGPADVVISAFVAAHLERPQDYFDRVAQNLVSGGKAFVTIAMKIDNVDFVERVQQTPAHSPQRRIAQIAVTAYKS